QDSGPARSFARAPTVAARRSRGVRKLGRVVGAGSATAVASAFPSLEAALAYVLALPRGLSAAGASGAARPRRPFERPRESRAAARAGGPPPVGRPAEVRAV